MKKNDDKVLISLKKAQSHITKIIEMIESGDYCIDVIQQLNAILGYVNSAKSEKLRNHLETCFLDGMNKNTDAKKKELIEEVMKVIKISK